MSSGGKVYTEPPSVFNTQVAPQSEALDKLWCAARVLVLRLRRDLAINSNEHPVDI